MLDRASHVLPHSTEAEMSTLGAMMLSEEALMKVYEILKPEDFYHPAHQILCEVIYSLKERNTAVDMLTVREELTRRNQLDEVGGVPALVTIVESVPTPANAEHYAQIVHEKAILRRLIHAAHEIVRLVDEPDLEVQDIVDRAEQAIFLVAHQRERGSFTPLEQAVLNILQHFEEMQLEGRSVLGVPTGYAELDRLTAGLQRSELTVLAARPSVGKTSLALNIAENIALREGLPVAIFSLEMAAEQLVQRMLCSQAMVSMQKIRHARLSAEEWDRLHASAERLFRAPIYIDDTSSLSPMEMRGKLRRLVAELQNRFGNEFKLGLVLIDYLQLMRSSNRRAENRNQEIGEIARALKNMAREFKVPVMVLSQLSRSVERRENKRPILSDLRDSGSIEAEADMVWFIHREDYYKQTESGERPPQPPPHQVTEVIVAKNRNGPVGHVELMFHTEFARFVPIERHYATP